MNKVDVFNLSFWIQIKNFDELFDSTKTFKKRKKKDVIDRKYFPQICNDNFFGRHGPIT